MENTTVINLSVNGVGHVIGVKDNWTLLELLREKLGLTGTKCACGKGECGACTVSMNGEAVLSCLTLAASANGKEIVTIEGLKRNGQLDPIQQAFVDYGAIQCGFCTPGMIMAAKALLEKNPCPSEEEVRVGINSNLCRCTGYAQIVAAIMTASKKLQGADS
ncbi:(2Fe-2S)-binding protein [Chloroflexota bacterium]